MKKAIYQQEEKDTSLSTIFKGICKGIDSRNQKTSVLLMSLASLSLIILIAAAVLAAIFAEPLVRYVLAPGFADNPEIEALTVDLLRVMLPSAVIFGLSGLVMGILNAHQKFFIPALTPAFLSTSPTFVFP